MNHKKIMAAAVSIAALASLAACGGVKDSGSASGFLCRSNQRVPVPVCAGLQHL